MGDIVTEGSPLFLKEFDHLQDDGFEGSTEEYKIFNEVFFGSSSSSNKGLLEINATDNDPDYKVQTNWHVYSDSGNSSLTSQYDYAKENFAGGHLGVCVSGNAASTLKSHQNTKLSIGVTTGEKPHPVNILSVSSPLEGVVSGFSDSVDQRLTYRIVESSIQGVTSSYFQLKPDAGLCKMCETNGPVSSKNASSTAKHVNKKKTSAASPISEESYAGKLLVVDPSVSAENKLQRPSKPKWKDSCFLKLGEEEFAMPTDIKNDPRPLLRYHINRLLRAAGWVIGRRKRNSKYNGIGEYVYKSPGGRPFREFHKAWYLCGESLLEDSNSSTQESDCMQWSDMSELWTDLSRTFKDIDENFILLESSFALTNLWCLLDPFANAVFIDKSIRFLKEGITVKAKRSLLVPPDPKPVVKSEKISSLESNDNRPLQEVREDHNCNQLGVDLFDVPIKSENAPNLSGGLDTVFPLEDVIGNHRLDIDKSAEIGDVKKVHKKSRKLSEMKHSAYDFNNGRCCPDGETSSTSRGSKKLKARNLNDDDLLISALMKSKTFKSTQKVSSRKSKLIRKRKTIKGSCKLLPRNLNKSVKPMTEGKWYTFGSRTVLSLLIHSGALKLDEVIKYRNLKSDVIKDGYVTRNGVVCKCCNNLLSISEFKRHSGFRLNCPYESLYLESGKPLTLCYLEAWSAEYKARKKSPRSDQVDEMDQNDDSCGRCGDVGELICCDSCPSAFHQACLFEEELPEGSWYCPQCRCQFCGNAVSDAESSQFHEALTCSQCEQKYHRTCLKLEDVASDTWFCGKSCCKVYTGLQSHVGLMNLLSNGFSWALLRCMPNNGELDSSREICCLKAECNAKLAVAITIFEECFLPMVDVKTGIDMIPQVIFNWGSQLARLNYSGFYTAILEKDDVILCVASIRIHGVLVAELPLVATCNKYRRQGMCRLLINSIEEMLKSLKVETLLVSAIPTLVETWTVGFGFQPLDEDERRKFSKINLMVFPGAVWLKKSLFTNHAFTDESGSHALTLGSPGAKACSAQGNDMQRICDSGIIKLSNTIPDCGILQNQHSELSSTEQDSMSSNLNVLVEGINTVKGSENGEQENKPEVFPSRPSTLDKQDCEQLSYYNVSIEEAIDAKEHCDSGKVRSNRPSFNCFHDKFSEHSSDVQVNCIFPDLFANVSPSDRVSLTPAKQG